MGGGLTGAAANVPIGHRPSVARSRLGPWGGAMAAPTDRGGSVGGMGPVVAAGLGAAVEGGLSVMPDISARPLSATARGTKPHSTITLATVASAASLECRRRARSDDRRNDVTRNVRRRAALLFSLSGLLAASALGTATAEAAGRSAAEPVAPEGWELVEGPELASLAGGELNTLAADNVEGPYGLQSVKNGLFVANEVTYRAPYTGLQRARSTGWNGSWEDLYLEWNEATESYAIFSGATGLYVAVEKNWSGSDNGLLRARSTSVGGWERFSVWFNEDSGHYALQSLANGRFVAMENSWTGTRQYALRARSTDINGSWEEFDFWG